MDAICELLKTQLALLHERYPVKSMVVGLSGGVDSVVLLHALATLRQYADAELKPLQAVYVNHGISDNALHWQAFCEGYCKQIGVPFYAQSVTVEARPRESLEAVARTARYKVLLEQARQVSGAVLTAHHQDDQLETVLLQLKRGAGPKGLSGMAAISEMNGVVIARPLLEAGRQQIVDYAQTHELSWVEDESNVDEQYDRNFLRQSILPRLTRRWPAMAQTVSRSAALCGEQQALLDEACDERLSTMTSASFERISVAALNQVSSGWQRALIRRWLVHNNALMPGAQQLEQVTGMLNAKADSQPLVKLKDDEIRRFNDELYYLKNVDKTLKLAPRVIPIQSDLHIETLGVYLRLRTNAQLTHTGQSEALVSAETVGLCAEDNNTVETPALSTKVKPVGKAHHKPIKDWLKAWRIPPWQRDKVLLLVSNQQPVALILNAKIVALENNGHLSAELSVHSINR